MVIVITENKVREREAYLPLACAFAEDAKNEKGCVSMKVAADLDQEDTVVFVSEWESKEDWQRHVGGAAFSKHIPGMGPYYVSGTDRFFEMM